MPDVTTGKGTKFAFGDGATPTENFTNIANTTNFGGPGLSRDTHDATNSDSPDGYREFIAGLRDGGEFSLDLDFVPGATGIETLLTHFHSDTPVNYRVIYPNAYRFVFKAFVTAFDPSAPIDDKMGIPATFKITGKPVLEPVA